MADLANNYPYEETKDGMCWVRITLATPKVRHLLESIIRDTPEWVDDTTVCYYSHQQEKFISIANDISKTMEALAPTFEISETPIPPPNEDDDPPPRLDLQRQVGFYP